MPFKATLEIGSKKFDVINCVFAFHRETDAKGRPAGIVHGGTVDLVIESTADTSILAGMVNNQHKPIDGKVIFKKDNEDAKMKELEFKTAYVVKYSEDFNPIDNKAMLLSFTVSAKELKMGDADLVNDWPE